MHLLPPSVGKARRPKFDLHLKIYDLNNVPLVSGSSFIKWHLAHSMHAEHRGRTSKSPINNHRVDYNFDKLVSHIRISVDKSNQLTECPIEFEVVQEFAGAEKIILGVVKLNLSEYIEESEAFIKDIQSHTKRRVSTAGISPTTVGEPTLAPIQTNGAGADIAQDGIVRRYLMQDSKVNSTLKIGILMVQIDGDRNFVAPSLRSAPVFGGIAGIVAGDQVEDDIGPVQNVHKPRDATEIQDLYRCTLAASWARLPSELPADECIEEIFAGGNGWKSRIETITTDSEEDDDSSPGGPHHGTLRPGDLRRMHLHHHSHQSQRHHSSNHRSHHLRNRTNSSTSDRSTSTVTGRSLHGSQSSGMPTRGRSGRLATDDRRDDDVGRPASIASLSPSINSRGSGSGSSGSGDDAAAKHAREVAEFQAREDLVAWRLPGGGSSLAT